MRKGRDGEEEEEEEEEGTIFIPRSGTSVDQRGSPIAIVSEEQQNKHQQNNRARMNRTIEQQESHQPLAREVYQANELAATALKLVSMSIANRMGRSNCVHVDKDSTKLPVQLQQYCQVDLGYFDLEYFDLRPTRYSCSTTRYLDGKPWNSMRNDIQKIWRKAAKRFLKKDCQDRPACFIQVGDIWRLQGELQSTSY